MTLLPVRLPVTNVVIADATSTFISTQKSNVSIITYYLRCEQGMFLKGPRVGFPINGPVSLLHDLAGPLIQLDFQRDKLNTKSTSPSPHLKPELRLG